MRHIKRIAFMLLGIAFAAGPAIVVAYSIIAHGNSTIGSYIGMILISILTTGVMCALGGLIGKLFEDSGHIPFTAFFMISFQKRKALYHSSMGEFELIIDEEEMQGILVRQGFFSCLRIAMFDIEREDFMETIKLHLDSKYKEEIEKEEERTRKKELVGKVMEKEGYLDAAAKRDGKISKLGI
jgi:hypothetical protein